MGKLPSPQLHLCCVKLVLFCARAGNNRTFSINTGVKEKSQKNGIERNVLFLVRVVLKRGIKYLSAQVMLEKGALP